MTMLDVSAEPRTMVPTTAAPRLNEPAARGLDEITHLTIAAAQAAYGLTFQSESWKQLGFASFEDWAAEIPKLQMTRPERRAKAVEYTVTLGMTQREAAAALGVSHATVGRDLGPNEPDTVVPEREDEATLAQMVQDEPDEPDQEELPIGASPELWTDLANLMEEIEVASSTDASLMAVNVPTRRRAATARRLRKLGTYMGSIALCLERMEKPK